MSFSPKVGRVGGAVQRGADALTATPAVLARAAERAAEPKHSPTDVVSHAIDGYWQERGRLGLGSPAIPPDLAETARVFLNAQEAVQGVARGLKGPDDKPIGAFIGFTINGSPNVAVGG